MDLGDHDQRWRGQYGEGYVIAISPYVAHLHLRTGNGQRRAFRQLSERSRYGVERVIADHGKDLAVIGGKGEQRGEGSVERDGAVDDERVIIGPALRLTKVQFQPRV